MILVDTGFFLALAQPRDALHSRAGAWVRSAPGPLLVTEYILWETVNSLSRSADRPRAPVIVDLVRTAKSYELLDATPEWFEAGLQLHAQRADKDWSLTDCISFVVMLRRGIRQALTYDHHFEQAGFEALLRHDPT